MISNIVSLSDYVAKVNSGGTFEAIAAFCSSSFACLAIHHV